MGATPDGARPTTTTEIRTSRVSAEMEKVARVDTPSLELISRALGSCVSPDRRFHSFTPSPAPRASSFPSANIVSMAPTFRILALAQLAQLVGFIADL